MASEPAIPIGETLASRYRLDAPLGRGAMGEVYRGHDLQLQRDVAVKMIAGMENADETRLMNEARSAAALNHPGLVSIYDVGRHGESPFLVMEYVRGEDLNAAPPRDLDGIVRMALQLLEAIGHAHAQGIVHRDLKPANVLVTESSGSAVYKITDFGLALSRTTSRITHQGFVVGTAAYLAPEQALGRAVDGRADLYALGVVLYELVAGRAPFEGHDALTVVSQHVHAPVTPPRTFRPDLPAALERVIMTLLAKDPAQRYSSAAEAAAALVAARAAFSADEAAATRAMPAANAATTGLLDQLVRGRLVGRESELIQLRGLWDRALGGSGHLALVSGEPGSGKTRLARELVVQAEVGGAVVLRGGCYEYEATTPYLPFVEALRLWAHHEPEHSLRELVADSGAELAKLAPELIERLGDVPPSPPLSAHEERLRLFDHVARFMQRLAAKRGLLFFADDLQWADQGTLALLHYLLRHLADQRFLVLGTYREIELDRRHPLAAALVDWNRERLATRIALGRLTSGETERLLAVLLGQDEVSGEFARAVFAETEGNPFFVEEVVKSLIDQGQIYRGGGEWQRGEIAELSIPQSVKSAIGRRLDRLGEACTELLRTAAALGKHFEYDELAASTGMPESQVLDALDEALAAQLIVTEGKDFAFSHDKIREVLYEELNPVRRRRLHQRIGEALEKLHATRLQAHVEDLAHHFAESGDLERGMRYAIEAGEAARKVFAFDEAMGFFQRAHECAEALGRTEEIDAIERAMADALDNAGRAVEAAAWLEKVLSRCTDAAERVRLRARAAKLYVDVADPRGRSLADEVLRESAPDRLPAAHALAAATKGRFAHLDGHHEEAVQACERALKLAEPLGDHRLMEELYAFLAGGNQHLARWEESDQWAWKLVHSGRERGAPVMEALGFEFLGENELGRGRWLRALEHSEAERNLVERIHAEDRLGWANMVRGWSLSALGRLAEAEECLRSGFDRCVRIGELRLGNLVQIGLVATLLDRGETRDALEILERAEADAVRMNLMFMRAEALRLRAVHAAREARWQDSLDQHSRFLDVVKSSDAMLVRIYFSPVVGEALLRLGRTDEARAHLDHWIPRTEAAGAVTWNAQLRRVEGLWHAERGDPAAARAALDRAIESFEAIGQRVTLGVTLLDRAMIRRGAGDGSGATDDANRAAQLFAECGAARQERRAREFLARG